MRYTAIQTGGSHMTLTIDGQRILDPVVGAFLEKLVPQGTTKGTTNITSEEARRYLSTGDGVITQTDLERLIQTRPEFTSCAAVLRNAADYVNRLIARPHGQATQVTNSQGVVITVGQEYYDEAGGRVRIDEIRQMGTSEWMAKRADSPSYTNVDLLRSSRTQPLHDLAYPTELERVLAHGKRAIDIYIHREDDDLRTVAQSYIQTASQDYPGRDIRIVVSPNPPPTGTEIGGRYSIVYAFQTSPLFRTTR